MKKRHFLLAGLVALLMIGCSDNELNQVDDSFIVDGNYKAYFKVAISNPPSTNSRALNNEEGKQFEDGVGNENKINSILFVFYNQNRNYVADKYMDISADQVKSDTENASIEATVDVVVPIGDQSAGSYVPYYVMAYVNPTQEGLTSNVESSLDGIKDLARESCYQNSEVDNPVFLMNNATYYASKSASVPSNAALVNGRLYASEEEANEGEVINIYVERLAARVSVNYDQNKVEAEKTALADSYTLTFKPKKWKLNGTAKKAFLVKQFGVKNEDGNVTNYSYDRVNGDFPENYRENNNNNIKWNDISNFRSYWCTSYFYADGKYPKNTFEVKDDNKKVTPELSLNYFSYDQAIANGNNFGADSKEYCLEHTINSATNSSAQQLAALTSVIVVGEYELKKTDGTKVTDETTFYRRGQTEDKKWKIFVGDEGIIGEMAKEQYLIYVKGADDDKYEKPSQTSDLTKIFKMEHPNSEIFGGWVAPGRYSYLQLADINETFNETKFYYLEDGKYTQITKNIAEEVKKTLNKQLATAVTPAEKYNKGMAYFTIPIVHFGNTENQSEQVGLGYYGVVRNHSYQINITDIVGMGTGIGEPDNPIVPPTETQSYYVKTRINVLAWRVAAEQNVVLGK